VLAAEDRERILSFVEKGLKAQRFVVDTTRDGNEGYSLATTEPYDALVLDIMLPGRDGLSLAKAVVEGHRGEIRIARADEERTLFEVVLTYWSLGSHLCAIRSLTTLPCTSVRRKSRPA
jgi:DNA-binding response OmpR family regulator